MRAGTRGVARAAAAISSVATKARIMPMPGVGAPSLAFSPMLSKPPGTSTMLPSALHAANTVKAAPNWPRSRPAGFGACGRPRATTTRAPPMIPASTTLNTTGPLPHRVGRSTLSGTLSIEYRSRNDAMNSNTAAPITTPSPRVRERIFTSVGPSAQLSRHRLRRRCHHVALGPRCEARGWPLIVGRHYRSPGRGVRRDQSVRTTRARSSRFPQRFLAPPSAATRHWSATPRPRCRACCRTRRTPWGPLRD